MAVQRSHTAARTPARGFARRRDEPHRSQRPRAPVSEPGDDPAPGDPGIGALIVFTAAALLVVVAVVVAGAVDRWWVLAPVMLVDFAVVFGVIATINRLLADDGDEVRAP